MAIEELGTALLARQRSRVEEQEREARKEEKRMQKYALATAGVQVANNFLAKRTEDFMNSEEINAQKALYKTAATNADRLLRLDEAIFQSGSTATDYFYNQLKPQFEEQAKNYVDSSQIGPAGAYTGMVDKEVRKLAEERAEAFNKALAQANSLINEEDFEAMLELNGKNARPTNVLSFLDSAARRVFSGRSREDLDAEALESITNSPELQNTEDLNLFMEAYKQTGDLVRSYDFATFKVPEVPRDERLKSTGTEQDISTVNDRVVLRTKTNYKDVNTGQTFQDTKVREILDLRNDAEKNSDSLARTLTDEVFDFYGDAREELTTPAFSAYFKLLDEEGINITNIKTLEDYNRASSLFAEFNRDPKNLKDPERSQIMSRFFESNNYELTTLFIQLNKENNPDARKKILSELATVIRDMSSIASSNFTETPENNTNTSPNTTTGTSEVRINFGDPLPEEEQDN